MRDALQGRLEPDLLAISAGVDRKAVESQLGHPKSTLANQRGGTTDLYQYLPPAEPSVFRAFAYSVFDLCSLGGWEYLARPQPKPLEVEYDDKDTVVSVRKPLAQHKE